MSFNKILVAIANSSLDASMLKVALEQAQLNQAVIKLLHCVLEEMIAEPTTPMPFESGLQPNLSINDYQTQKILVEQQMEEAKELLEQYRQQAANQGVPTESEYQIGDAGYLLCEEAKKWGADLIVVGRHGRSGLEEMLVGSVSNYVVHHAPCSVLVIQATESETWGKAVVDWFYVTNLNYWLMRWLLT